jgi:hypothetical protein
MTHFMSDREALQPWLSDSGPNENSAGHEVLNLLTDATEAAST